MNEPNPKQIDDDLPELDDAFFADARPAGEVMGEAFMARARRAGRPKPGSTTTGVTRTEHEG